MDEAWGRGIVRGTVRGTKIFGLKFANNVALIADHAEGFTGMLSNLE